VAVLGYLTPVLLAAISMNARVGAPLVPELRLVEPSILAETAPSATPDLSLLLSRSSGWLAATEGPPDAGSASPGQGQPAKPGEGQPAKPGEGQPAKPGEGQPAKPGEGQPAKPGEGQPAKPKAETKPKPGPLDFDLLGAPPKEAQKVDEKALRLRRTMLTWHQGVGIGMFALQLATTAVGQLNYNDKFGGDNTGKYAQPHAILAYSTFAAFAATAALALLAPEPVERNEGIDRVTVHKIAMFTAAAGMVAQAVLGIWTQSREGYLNQKTVGTAHLAVGYFTLAAVSVGIGVLVF
jgi:hypothetical protein